MSYSGGIGNMTEDLSRLSAKLSEMVWSQCVYCRNLEPGGKCPAFPEGIPEAINLNWHDHHHPFPGDRGIRFEPIDGYENIEIKPLIPTEGKNDEGR